VISDFEHWSQPLANRARFTRRLLSHGLAALVAIGISLVIGTLGYHWIAQQAWIDSFLNACMLLGGMGPVGDIATTGGKVFAGLYALYCGLVFILVSGILLAPFLHRVLHVLHLDDKS
jgi:hypothetical protein